MNIENKPKIAHFIHHLRSRLNTIIGFTELLMESCVQGEQSTYLQQISNSGEETIELINDFVELNKIPQQQDKMLCNIEFIINILTELEKIYSPLAKKQGLKLICKIPEPIPCDFYFTIDHVKLKLILINLIENAIKYTPKGVIVFGFTINHDTIRYYVEDTGIGIKAEDIEQIFSPFYRSNNNPKKIDGSGLGLSIASECASYIGSSLCVKSKLGQGSYFYFDQRVVDKGYPSN